MECLPIELYINVFKYLPIDFIKISVLSKHFNIIYKSIKVDVAHNLLSDLFERVPSKSAFIIYGRIYIIMIDILNIDIIPICHEINQPRNKNMTEKTYNKYVIECLDTCINMELRKSINVDKVEPLKSLIKCYSLRYLKINFSDLLQLLCKKDNYGCIIMLLKYITNVPNNKIDINVYKILECLLVCLPGTIGTVYIQFRYHYLNNDIITDIVKLLAKCKCGITNKHKKLLRDYAHVTNNESLKVFLAEL